MTDSSSSEIKATKTQSNELNCSVKEYAATILLKHLHSLRDELAGVREGSDPECIHRLRVASRRIRNALEIFWNEFPQKKVASWEKGLRTSAHALNRIRDLDVQIELIESLIDTLEREQKPGLRRLLLRLKQKRSALQQRILNVLEKFEKSHVLDQLEKKLESWKNQGKSMISPDLISLAKGSIGTHVNVFLSWATSLQDEHAVEAHHAMRIAAKHLRYTLETFLPLLGKNGTKALTAARSCQDALGKIHDCDMWLDFLPSFIEDEQSRVEKYFGQHWPYRRLIPGLMWLKENRQNERNMVFSNFVRQWDNWQKNAFWEKVVIILDESTQASLSKSTPETFQ